MKLEGSKTEQNLKDAFESESTARSRYIFYAEHARSDDSILIANAFEEAARNEQEHAKIWFKLFSKYNNNIENLKSAIANENYESTKMYIDFANTARAEGFDDIAIMFEAIAKIEHGHEEKFKKLLSEDVDLISNWQCGKCGYKHDNSKAPKNCPVCEQYRVGGIN